MVSKKTFLTNDEWAKRKGFVQFNSNTTDGYLDEHDTPNAIQLENIRLDAFSIIARRIGSDSGQDIDFLKSLEYLIIEVLRQYEIAIKRGQLELILSTVNQLLNIIPSEQAVDLSLDSEDAEINRGATSG